MNLLSKGAIRALFVLGVVTSAVHSNQAPIIISFTDTATYTTNTFSMYLIAEVSDDTTPIDSLRILWRMISGPAAAEFSDSNATTTEVWLTDIGEYRFEFSVSDGQLTTKDTARILLRQAAEFKVLTPQNLQEIEIGKPFTIRWQREPLTPCVVYYQLGDDPKYHDLTPFGAVNGPTLVWNVASNLVHGTTGTIVVQRYQAAGDEAIGTFTLVEKYSGVSQNGGINRKRSDFGIQGDVKVFDIQGRSLPARQMRTPGIVVMNSSVGNRSGHISILVNSK